LSGNINVSSDKIRTYVFLGLKRDYYGTKKERGHILMDSLGGRKK